MWFIKKIEICHPFIGLSRETNLTHISNLKGAARKIVAIFLKANSARINDGGPNYNPPCLALKYIF